MTELQELKQFIKKRFPIGTIIEDSTRSQPYVINKRTVYWVKPWKPEDYNDQMRPDDDRHYTVDFMVHDPGNNSPVYDLGSYPKSWCLEKYSHKSMVEKYKLTCKNQYSKQDPDGKHRNYMLFFLNDVLILKQKIPFDTNYDKGFDRVTSIYDVYLLNGSIHQTRGGKWYCGQSERPEGKERKVKFPVSKERLSGFNIPKGLKIDLNDE